MQHATLKALTVQSVPSVQKWSERQLWVKLVPMGYIGLVVDQYHKDLYFLSTDTVHYVCRLNDAEWFFREAQ